MTNVIIRTVNNKILVSWQTRNESSAPTSLHGVCKQCPPEQSSYSSHWNSSQGPACLHLAHAPQTARLGSSLGTEEGPSSPDPLGPRRLGEEVPSAVLTVPSTAPRACAPEPHHPSAPQGHPQQLSHCITPAQTALRVPPAPTFLPH